MKPYTGPLMTLGGAAAHAVRLVVWCRDCQHQVEPDPAVHAARSGAEMPVLDWRKRLIGYGLPHPPVGPRQSSKG